MDGVLADFEHGKKRILGDGSPDLNKAHECLSVEEMDVKLQMYDLMREDKGFYFTLPPMPDGLDLYQELSAYDPIILTAAPSHFSGDYMKDVVRKDKRRWCQVHLELDDDNRFVCTTSAEKHNFIGHREGDVHVLIDDREQNCQQWRLAGGVAILHKNTKETLKSFAEILAEREETGHKRSRRP